MSYRENRSVGGVSRSGGKVKANNSICVEVFGMRDYLCTFVD